MPHKVYDLPALTASQDLGAVALVPGVTPGMGIHNIFAQRRMKRVLMIQDAYIEIHNIDAPATVDYHSFNYYLKLSQEPDLTPGLILPVGRVGTWITDAAAGATQSETGHSPNVEQYGHRLAGTLWAPRFVGIRAVESGTLTAHVDVHLDYEVVEVPWQQWFIMWDFLDNVVDNERQY